MQMQMDLAVKGRRKIFMHSRFPVEAGWYYLHMMVWEDGKAWGLDWICI